MTSAAAPQEVGNRRASIAAAMRALGAMGLIWRETGPDPFGADGEIGFVDISGDATGRRILVRAEPQGSPDLIAHPAVDERVQRYLSAHPLPLIRVSHDPASGACYWGEAATEPGGSELQLLGPGAFAALSQLSARAGDAWLNDLPEVLGKLLERRGGDHFPVSHFDLFVHGLTDIARSLYFGTDLALLVAEQNLAAIGPARELHAGPREHAFLFDFVRFLVAQDLAAVDFPRRLVDWVDHGRQAQFVAPLTRRGREVVQLIQSLERRLVSTGDLVDAGYAKVAQEAFFGMAPMSLGSRPARIRQFQIALQRRPPC